MFIHLHFYFIISIKIRMFNIKELILSDILIVRNTYSSYNLVSFIIKFKLMFNLVY